MMHRRSATALVSALAVALLVPAPALAAKRKTGKKVEEKREVRVEDVGVLRNEDVRVVQKNLFVKKDRPELGFMILGQPWDVYVGGVMAGFNLTLNPAEQAGFELMVQGGYGWGTGHFRDVSYLGQSAGGALTGLASDAARELLGGSVNLVLSPIYAKLAWGGRRVLHFDVYLTLGGHGFLAQRLDPRAVGANGSDLRGLAGPSLGAGLKFFLSQKTALKIDLRDHMSFEVREYTGRFTLRNNWQIGIGLAFYTKDRNQARP
jgi:outer membrane beta-barrel protein